MKTRMILSTKVTAGFAAMFTLSSMLSLSALSAISSLKDRFDIATNQTARKIELAGEINSLQSNMFSDQHGMLLSRFSKDAEHFEQFKKQFDRDAGSLRTSVG